MNRSEDSEELPPSPIPYIRQGDIVELDSFYTDDDSDDSYDSQDDCRQGRKLDADDFRHRFSYGSSSDHKTFVWPGGIHPWEDKSSGTIWVGVHGLDSICVVTRTGDLDVTRVRRDYKHLTIETVLRKFRKTVISEIEDLASPSSKLCNIFGSSIPKPFGIVSVIPCADNSHNERLHEASSNESEEDEDAESSQVVRRIKALLKKNKERQKKEWVKFAGYENTIKFLQEQKRIQATFSKTVQASCAEYDDSEAIDFLLEKMKKIEAFTVDEVIKVAISAFQHLFQKVFKAKEIEVTVMDPCYDVSTIEETNYRDMYVKELGKDEIQYYLDVVNEEGGIGCLRRGRASKRRLLQIRSGNYIWKGIRDVRRAE